MSWFSSAKKLAEQAAAATAEAAKAASAIAVATVEDMKSPPSVVACSGCGLQLAVPQEVFTWLCQTPSCLATGASYALSDSKCAACGAAQPPQPPPEIACGACNAHTIVPKTKAEQQLLAAKDQTVKITNDAVAFTSAQYQQLRSVPAQVPCCQCRAPIAVPATIFDYTCANCQFVNMSPELKEGQIRRDLPPSVCTQCKSAAPTEPVAVMCDICKVPTTVPRSNLGVALGKAAHTTKTTAAAASAYANAQYKVLSAAPTVFNCEHCNAALRVEGVNPDDFKGSNVMLTCGSCQRATTVPKTNFHNSIRETVSVATRQAHKVYYTVSKKPTVTCDTCQAVVPLPAPEEAKDNGSISVTCKKCNTVLTAMAAPAPPPVAVETSDAPPAYQAQ